MTTWRCCYYANNDYRQRCKADATHKLRKPNGSTVRGMWCEKHAREIVTEYRDKLGWNWAMEPMQAEEAHDDHAR